MLTQLELVGSIEDGAPPRPTSVRKLPSALDLAIVSAISRRVGFSVALLAALSCLAILTQSHARNRGGSASATQPTDLFPNLYISRNNDRQSIA
jgi:hypothetical protein